MKRLFLLLFVSVNLLSCGNLSAQGQSIPYTRSDRLGITHISDSTTVTTDQRYAQALQLGAGWNRWPIYWDRIESTPDQWTWDAIDGQTIRDIQHGLQINAILLGIPADYRDGDRIASLNEPIFSDGTDTPGDGKTLNPANRWAVFVARTVNRYKPGGELARMQGWSDGPGIRVWEIWNEPDFTQFWSAGHRAYARLLKVAYLAAKQVDPDAQILFGGLLYPTENNFLALTMNEIIQDAAHEANNWYFDLVAVHSYGDPWRSGWLVLYARQTMIEFGVRRPIWLNESGVPVWDDYPGPTWQSDAKTYATLDQQAYYFIQSSALAWSEGADKVFLHQLYDDCGDQPAGTNFPPHNGELCVGDRLCYGDAHGIYRNLPDSICFSQSPLAGTPRPIARAYRLVADIFGTEAFEAGDLKRYDADFAALSFERPRTGERIVVMWNRGNAPDTIELTATGALGRLISLQSDLVIEPETDGLYRITLPPAADDADESGATVGGAAIGGMPYILIETRDPDAVPSAPELLDLGEPSAPTSTPDNAPQTMIRPTVDPANDRQAPLATVLPLSEFSPATFTVSWEGMDDSGIRSYVIWVRVDGGDWQAWQTTDATSADYTGEAGRVYEFAAWAEDLAGNWSENIQIQPQARTTVSG